MAFVINPLPKFKYTGPGITLYSGSFLLLLAYVGLSAVVLVAFLVVGTALASIAPVTLLLISEAWKKLMAR